MRRLPFRVAAFTLFVVFLASLSTSGRGMPRPYRPRTGMEHKSITSKYTFNEDVFAIFRDKCGRCHVTDGVAPMSLVAYQEAFPWAESLRMELLADTMPPPLHTFSLSARELDVILMWSSGGTPQGNAANKPPALTLKNDWIGGKPDLALPMPAGFTLPADAMETSKDFAIVSGLPAARPMRAFDLLPGTPAIVRGATLFLKTAPKAAEMPVRDVPGEVLATWTPGQDAPSLAVKPVRLPAGAELVLRIHYKKSWKQEGAAVPDRSTVGLYFSDGGTSRLR